MKAAWVAVGASVALAGCVGPYGDEPMRMSPPLGYSSPAYTVPAYAPPPYEPPAYTPLPPPPEPTASPGIDDLPPVVFQPNAPPSQPDAAPATPPAPGPDPAPDPSPAPSPAPVAAAPVPVPTVPERGGDVPLMGFRPMKGQKAPTPTTTP